MADMVQDELDGLEIIEFDDIAESPYDALDDDTQDDADNSDDFNEAEGDEPTGEED